MSYALLESGSKALREDATGILTEDSGAAPGTTLPAPRPVRSPRRTTPGRAGIVGVPRPAPSAPGAGLYAIEEAGGWRILTEDGAGAVLLESAGAAPTLSAYPGGSTLAPRDARRPNRGAARVGRPAPAATPAPPPPGAGQVLTSMMVRRARRSVWVAASGAIAPGMRPAATSRPVSSPRRLPPGRGGIVGTPRIAYPWEHLQSAGATTSGAAPSLPVALPRPVAAGHLVVVAIVGDPGPNFAISDTQGNAYNLAIASNGATPQVSVWYAQAATSGPLTVIVAATAAADFGAAVDTYRYAPGGGLAPLGSAGTSATSASPAAGPIAFAGAGLDYAVASAAAAQGAITPGPGYSLRYSVPYGGGTWGIAVEDRINDLSGSATPGFAYANPVPWIALGVVFGPAPPLVPPVRPAASPRRLPPGAVRWITPDRPATPGTPLASVKPVASPRHLAPGRVRQGPAVGKPTAATIRAVRPAASPRRPAPGRAAILGLPRPAPAEPPAVMRPVGSPHRPAAGRVWLPRPAPWSARPPAIARPVARLGTPPRRPRVWWPRGFELGQPATAEGTPYGLTDPDAATLVPWAPGIAPPSLATSDPDAATLVLWAADIVPSSLAISDPDSARLL